MKKIQIAGAALALILAVWIRAGNEPVIITQNGLLLTNLWRTNKDGTFPAVWFEPKRSLEARFVTNGAKVTVYIGYIEGIETDRDKRTTKEIGWKTLGALVPIENDPFR